MPRRATGHSAVPRPPADAVSIVAEAPQSAYTAEPAGSLAAERVQMVLASARDAGMLDDKTTRISGRISPLLVQQAKRRSGMESDTDLIEFALASVALEDPFLDVFAKVRGSVDPDIELGY